MSQYKISKKRLAEIIKEEYQSLQHRKTRRLNEDASDDTFEMVDVIAQALGPQQVQAMERSNAQDLLSYVMRMHDMRMPGDEVEDYDASAYNRQEDDLDEGYMDKYDRAYEEEERERRRQSRRIDKERERNQRSGRTGVGTRMGGSYKKERFAGFNRKDEASKPDYIDLDKDGDREEPMKKAAKDKKIKKETTGRIYPKPVLGATNRDDDLPRSKRREKKLKKESVDSIRALIQQELKNL
jgi:hypothetical protein